MAWESKTKIFGLPLVSFGFFARGFIAIGFSGVGVITIAQFGGGIIAFTQFGFGIFSVAQFSLGVVAVAQLGIGLLYAFGQAVLGFLATGPDAAGYYVITDSADVINNTRALLAMVKADPTPLVYYLVLWGMIITYFSMQKRKITSDMKIWDLFRPMSMHTEYRIRMKSVKEETDNNRLYEIAVTDKNRAVSMAALERINDQSLLARFVTATHAIQLRIKAAEGIFDTAVLVELLNVVKDPHLIKYIVLRIRDNNVLKELIRNNENPAVTAMAVTGLENPDARYLKDLAIREVNSDILNAVMERINDRDVRVSISREARSPLAKSLAIAAVNNPGSDFLLKIIESDEVLPVKVSALERLKDQIIIEKIARGHPEPPVRAEAVRRILNRVSLKDLLDREDDQEVVNAVQGRLDNTAPEYLSMKLEFRCPHCSQPVFVNGPLREGTCTFCLSDIPLENFWSRVKRSSHGIVRDMSYSGLVIEKGMNKPHCHECGALLDTDFIDADSEKEGTCPSCGHRYSSFPMPEYFRWSDNADHIFCAERDGEDDSIREKTKPVSISCIKCGAPLEITVETPRNATCGYCNTVQYLPDPLWFSLHPMKTRREWYIRSRRKSE